MNIDIAVIRETKKKLRGIQDFKDHILLYSGVERNQRAAAGIYSNFDECQWKNKIYSYCFVNERIRVLCFNLLRGYIAIIAVYAPAEGKVQESEEFYNQIEVELDKINTNDYLIIAGE